MKKTLILKIGGEGGSIKLYGIGNEFVFTTDESTLMDLLNEEDREGLIFKSRSELFDTFDLAMKSMLDKYPVFRLYPLEINNEFKDQINKYYQDFLLKNKRDDFWRNDEWERILTK